jgi:hypothetical protein
MPQATPWRTHSACSVHTRVNAVDWGALNSLCEELQTAEIAGLTDESVCPTLARISLRFLWGRRFRLPTDCCTAWLSHIA